MECSKCNTKVLYCPCCGEKLVFVSNYDDTSEDLEKTVIGKNITESQIIDNFTAPNPTIDAPQKPSSAKAVAKLVLIDDNKKDPEVFFLDKDTHLVGRPDLARDSYPEVDLSFDKEGTISRYHARVHNKGSEFFVEDLNSGNGTFIFDGKQLEKLLPGQLYPLKSRNRIRFGKVLMQFLIE